MAGSCHAIQGGGAANAQRSKTNNSTPSFHFVTTQHIITLAACKEVNMQEKL